MAMFIKERIWGKRYYLWVALISYINHSCLKGKKFEKISNYEQLKYKTYMRKEYKEKACDIIKNFYLYT